MQLKISIEKNQNKSLTIEQGLTAKFPSGLLQIEKLSPQSQRDDGSLARYNSERVGLSNVARNTFYFQGIAKNNQLSDEQDKVMVEIIRSFRRLAPEDKAIDSVLRIDYQRLEPGETFSSLAKSMEGKAAEDDLRLLNGFYPKGEAELGTWIKLLKRDAE